MGKRIPPFRFKPKPPAPRRKQKPLKGGAGSKKKWIDVFKTILDADTGSGSSGQSHRSYETYLKLMSKPQLKRLEKKIRRLQNTAFKGRRTSTEKREIDHVSRSIEKRTKLSQEFEADINLRIKQRLDSLALKTIEVSDTGKAERVRLHKQWIDLDTLIEQKFADIYADVEKLLDSGQLIAYHSSHGPNGYIRRVIRNYL